MEKDILPMQGLLFGYVELPRPRGDLVWFGFMTYLPL